MIDLKEKSIQTVRWTFLYQFANYAITFVLSIVLARLITPTEFGLTAMVAIFISIANILINSGFSSSLIRFKDSTPDDYSTVFYFNIFISFFLYVLIFFSAPFIADFYSQPELIPITRLITLVFVIGSFSIIQNTILIVDLNFKKQVILSLISLFISVVVAIILALKNYGVYSIVWQTLIQTSVYCILLWATSKWRPVGRFNIKSIKKLWKFSSYVFFTGIFNSIADNLDNIIIGKIFQSNTLGLFVRAKSTRGIPQNIMSSVLSTTTFSVLSKVNDNIEEFRIKHLQFYRITIFFLIPFTIAFYWICDDFILFFYGDKWAQAIPLLKILSIGLIPIILGILISQSIMSFGDSKLQMQLSVVKRIIIICILPTGFIFGMEKFMIIFVVAQYIGLVIDFYFIRNKLSTLWMDYFKPIVHPLGFSILFSIILLSFKSLEICEGYLINILFDTFIMLLIYMTLSFKFNNSEYRNFIQLIPLPKFFKK